MQAQQKPTSNTSSGYWALYDGVNPFLNATPNNQYICVAIYNLGQFQSYAPGPTCQLRWSETFAPYMVEFEASRFSLDWIANAKADDHVSDSTLGEIIEGVNNILRLKRPAEMDRILRSLPVEELAPNAIVVIARLTFALRERLYFWNQFLDRARTSLAAKGVNATTALAGLI